MEEEGSDVQKQRMVEYLQKRARLHQERAAATEQRCNELRNELRTCPTAMKDILKKELNAEMIVLETERLSAQEAEHKRKQLISPTAETVISSGAATSEPPSENSSAWCLKFRLAYGVKLATLVLLRTLQEGVEFYFAMHMQAVKEFGDLVLKIVSKENKTYFIDLKPEIGTAVREDDLTQIISNFNTFLKEFEKIYKFTRDLKFCGNLEGCEFVIFTRATEIVNESLVDSKDFVTKVLSTSECKELLLIKDRVKIFTKQASADELKVLLKKQVQRVCGVSSEISAKHILSKLLHAIEEWSAEDTGSYMTNHSFEKILNEAKEEVCNYVMNIATESSLKDLYGSSLENLTERQVLVIDCSDIDTKAAAVYTHKILRATYKDRFIMVGQIGFLNCYSEILFSMEKMHLDVLVIKCDKSDDSLAAKLHDVLSQGFPFKKVILLCSFPVNLLEHLPSDFCSRFESVKLSTILEGSEKAVTNVKELEQRIEQLEQHIESCKCCSWELDNPDERLSMTSGYSSYVTEGSTQHSAEEKPSDKVQYSTWQEQGDQETPSKRKQVMQCYQKIPGTSAMHGVFYEMRLAALFYARGMNMAKNFHLAYNMEGPHGFDDLVLMLNNRTYFIQVKARHRILQNELFHGDKPFSIVRFFRYYCDVKKHWSQREELKQFGNFEDAMFIVYTNAKLSEKIVNVEHEHDILRELNSGGKCLSFRNLKRRVIRLPFSEEGSEPLLEEFWSQFFLLTEQAFDNKLEELIKKELPVATDEIYMKFTQKMDHWCNTSNCFLTENSDIWLNTVNSMIDDVSSLQLKELEKIDINFDAHTCVKLREAVKIKNYISCFTHSTVGSKLLCALYCHQSFADTRHMIVDLRTLLHRREDIMSLWGRWCKLLVVIEDNSTLIDLDKSLDEDSERILVYVSSVKKYPDIVMQKVTINDFDEVSQSRILTTRVSFQGEIVPLSVIIDEEDALHPDVITQLSTDRVVLGDNLERDLDFYMPQTLLFSGLVSPDILLETSVALTVSGNIEQAPKNISAIINKEDFLKVVETQETVHWLHSLGEKMMWVESRGETTILKKHLLSESYTFKQVDSVMDVPHSTVLVCSDPGMGTSTLLAHLALQTKRHFPEMWILTINLCNVTRYMYMLPSNFELPHVLEFLLDVSAVSQKWKPVFKRKLERMKNVCIFVDGFSDVSPMYTDKLIRMFKHLQSSKVKKLCVAARSNMRSKLETELLAPVFSLQPFLEAEKREFLERLYKSKMSFHTFSEGRLNYFIENILQKSLVDKTSDVYEHCSTPLELVLFAEALEYQLKE